MGAEFRQQQFDDLMSRRRTTTTVSHHSASATSDDALFEYLSSCECRFVDMYIDASVTPMPGMYVLEVHRGNDIVHRVSRPTKAGINYLGSGDLQIGDILRVKYKSEDVDATISDTWISFQLQK